MRTAIATVCLSGTLSEKLEAIAAAGFRAVEIFENDLIAFNGAPRDIRAMCEGLGLAVAVLQPFRDFEGLPEPLRARAFARAERKFDVMGELGCDLLMICSSVAPDAVGGIDRASADLRELAERAAARGLRLGYEALAWGRHVNDYRDAWEIVRRADHPSLGLVLDSFHALARGTDLAPVRAIPKNRIALVQLADAPRLHMDALSWSRHHRCFPGQGELDVPAFTDALAATGFLADKDALLSLEIFNDRFRAGSARAVARDGRRSVIALLDGVGTRMGREATDAAPLPPRAAPRGVEFVEFALDEASRPGFERTLTALGFRLASRHRSKAVARWTQGEINLVVNAEDEGFAHAFHQTRGASVCALALRVEDAEATLSRAVALLDEPFRQAVAPGELDIPAVRGLGGSLVYLVDERLGSWHAVDFVPAGGEASAPAHGAELRRVDHVSQAMPHEEMLSWLLFYGSLFDVGTTPGQSVLDPGGVVQSQALETADGRLRLVLNASQSRRTQAARFLGEGTGEGSGAHHIAFETDDIVATVERLRAAGVGLLPIPANYYDDLEARTDLEPARIEALRRNDVLHEREPGGEFLHAYTTPVLDGGLFFEIVERRGARGYGATNAPIRLAAQTRLAERQPPADPATAPA